MSKVKATDGEAVLTRVSASYLEITGISHAGCGGSLRVQDWRQDGVRRDPYEIFCDKCSTCYPDGCQTLADILPAARRYFSR